MGLVWELLALGYGLLAPHIGLYFTLICNEVFVI